MPHFIHSPFYVYAYAFGDCLVNSLYGVFERRPRASPSAISPCSRPAAPSTYTELLAPFGLDAPRSRLLGASASASSPGLIDELERLPAP